MGRIADARGDEALFIAGELVDILSELAEDGELIAMLSGGAASGKILSRIFKNHGEAALRLLALDDGLDPEAEKSSLSPSSLPGRVLALLGDGAVTGLFGSAAAESVVRGSSAASENGTGSHLSPSSSGG